MESTVPAVCFVRCPKCLRVLAELPEIPLFKCCGCDAILSAEVHSDNCSSDNGLAVYVKQISTASDKPETLDQAAMKKFDVSESNGEKKFEELESSRNGMKTPDVSDSNGESSKEKRGSAVYEENNISKRSLEQDKVKPTDHSDYSAHSLNQVVWKSTDRISPEANDRWNSSDALEQTEEPLEDKNGTSFRLRTRSSHAYDGSFSSSDEERKDHLPLSIKASNLVDIMKEAGGNIVMKNSFNALEQPAAQSNSRKFSIKEEPSLTSQSKDGEHFVKFMCSEKDDPVKILKKVDELKIKLHRMFSKRADGKESSSFSIKVTRFEEKASSKENQLSLIPSSRQPINSSSLLCHPAVICCRNGKCRRCRETQIRHCRPVSGGAPFVICYRCYRLLQLPTDFLVPTKRVHKLRCGSCSEVLMYSYRPRTRE